MHFGSILSAQKRQETQLLLEWVRLYRLCPRPASDFRSWREKRWLHTLLTLLSNATINAGVCCVQNRVQIAADRDMATIDSLQELVIALQRYRSRLPTTYRLVTIHALQTDTSLLVRSAKRDGLGKNENQSI